MKIRTSRTSRSLSVCLAAIFTAALTLTNLTPVKLLPQAAAETDLSVLTTVAKQRTPSVAELKAANADPDAKLVEHPKPSKIFNPFVISTLTGSRITTPQEHFTGLFGRDSFFKEPKLTGKEPVGTLLKYKRFEMQLAAAAIAGVRPAKIDAFMMMYVTERLDKKLNISTGVILIPRDGRKNSTRQIIGYQEANDSLGPRCHPSSQWTGGVFSEASAWSALGPLAQMFGKGYAMVITDVGNNGKPGPNGISEVFAGRYAGMALLNAMRASYQVTEAGLNKDNAVGFYGIAGGGTGAGFAAEYQPWYYPELKLKAAVLQNFNADQKQFVKFTNGSMAAGFGFATLVGLNETYPAMRLQKHLSPLGKAAAGVWAQQCQTYAYFVAGFLRFEPFFNNWADPSEIKDFQPAFADSVMGVDKTGPKAKLLITSCGTDGSFMSVTPAADMRKLTQRYRDRGTKVTYLPAKCNDLELVTSTYNWLTDLFGMQTIEWLSAKLKEK